MSKIKLIKDIFCACSIVWKEVRKPKPEIPLHEQYLAEQKNTGDDLETNNTRPHLGVFIAEQIRRNNTGEKESNNTEEP